MEIHRLDIFWPALSFFSWNYRFYLGSDLLVPVFTNSIFPQFPKEGAHLLIKIKVK